MNNRRAITRVLPLLAMLSLPMVATGQAVLPEPLTLSAALALADEAHPVLEMQRARLDQDRASQQLAQDRGGWDLGLTANLRAVHPSYKAPVDTANDSSVRLRLRRSLYDGGRREAAQAAADALLSGQEMAYLDARQQRRLTIMRNYFDVLLADLQYIRDNEAMTMGFLYWDKARQRKELGQLSDIEVLALESEFQQRRREWQQSQNMQRASRLQLAISLNRPDQLSTDLADPVLDLQRELPEVDRLTEQVLANNPGLLALRREVEAAQSGVEAAKAANGLTISGELEAAAYNRTTSTRDPLAASLVIEMPLFTSSYDAELARQRALLREQRARLANAELELRQSVLDLWLEIRTLKVKQEEMAALGAYRDLYIDRSRAYYELEIKSDLGDAQTQISDYRLRQRTADLELAMAWARLDALRGLLITPVATADEGTQ